MKENKENRLDASKAGVFCYVQFAGCADGNNGMAVCHCTSYDLL